METKVRGIRVSQTYRTFPAKQRDTGADVSALEREIDELVYALYGLTPEEKSSPKPPPNENHPFFQTRFGIHHLTRFHRGGSGGHHPHLPVGRSRAWAIGLPERLYLRA